MDIHEIDSDTYDSHYSGFKIPEIYHDKNFIMKQYGASFKINVTPLASKKKKEGNNTV